MDLWFVNLNSDVLIVFFFPSCIQLFDFADKYRGKYDSSITVAQKYYRSISGYNVSTYVPWAPEPLSKRDIWKAPD